jgi:hypothetical protein
MQNNNKILVSLPNGTCRLVTHTLKSYADIDYTFDESLVPNGIFREVYDYIKSGYEVPEQFIFTGVLAMFCGIVGNRISTTFGTQKFKPHDYFTLIQDRGYYEIEETMKSVRSILRELEKEVTDKDKPYQKYFLYPDGFLYPRPSTLRGLLDTLREESESELRARSVAKKKGKPEPPLRVQRSGVAIIYDVTVLFDANAMKSISNRELAYTLFGLWDGNPRMTAIRIRKDEKMQFGDTALTLLSASEPEAFVEYLPKGELLELILSSFQIINAGRRLKPLKSLGRLISEWQNNGDEIKKRYNEILEKLKQFYQFVCTLSQSKSPVLVSDEAEALDKQSAQAWHEERTDLDETTAGYMTEITARYMTRLDVHKVRYALLFSILECYEQHGQSANAITITGTAVQKAIEVCELFKKHTLHFLVKAKEIRPRLFR